jgi:hypothetical protein
VLGSTELNPLDDATREVQTAWLEKVAERYFAVSAAAVRAADPNHLVIGSRFAGDAPEWAWRACARHCDVVTFNHYPRVDFEGGDASELATVFQRYYGLVRRPMMITEWSFPALDAGLPCTAGAGMRVDTQEQKAKCFEVMQHLLFRLPFMVGSDYFMWVDEPAQGITDTFPEDSNYGLVDLGDRPWPELTAMAARLNPLARRLHSGEVPEVYLMDLECGPKGIRVTARNLGSAQATADIRIATGAEVLSAPRIALAPGSEGTVQIAGDTRTAPQGLRRITAELVQPEGWLPRGCRGVVKLTRYMYNGAEPEKPLVVVNAGTTDLPALPVLLPVAAEAGTALHCSTTDNLALSLLPFADGMRVMRVPELAAGAALTGFVRPRAAAGTMPVKVERRGDQGYAIDNGLLRLEHDGTSGNVFDRISVGGVLLGRCNPLLWQQPDGDNQWAQTDSLAAADLQDLPGGVVVTVTAQHGGAAGVITAVDDQGRMAAARRPTVPFGIVHCFVVLPQVPFVVTRCVSVKNLDPERPLVLMAPFFYLQSFIGGKVEGDVVGVGRQVPNYYRVSGSASWHDEGVGAWYGCAPLDERIQAQFWLDEGGGQHPDARLLPPEPVTLPPGGSYEPSGCPALLVYGALDKAEGAQSWTSVRQAVDGIGDLQVVSPGTAPAE